MPKLVCALLCLASLAAAQESARKSPPKSGSGYLGVHVAPLNAETRASFRVPGTVKSGVLITHIEKASAAERAGLRIGDVITRLGKHDISDVDALIARVNKRRAGDRIGYRVSRGTGSIEGVLVLGRRPAAPRGGERVAPDRPEIVRKPSRGDLDKRLDSVSKQIEELRRRALEAKAKAGTGRAKTRKPNRGLAVWIKRERQGLAAAKQKGDERRMAYHAARLALLGEMGKAGTRVAGPTRGNMGARFNRIEKKLDRLLKLITQELEDDDDDDDDDR